MKAIFEGKAIYYYNEDRKEVDFKIDEKVGKRIYYFITVDKWNWRIQLLINGDKNDRGFKNGKKEVKGIMHYKEGYRYEGNFNNDVLEGNGIYVKPSILISPKNSIYMKKILKIDILLKRINLKKNMNLIIIYYLSNK